MADIYSVLNEIIQKHLIRQAIKSERVGDITKQVIHDLANRCGGQTVYLKNNHADKVAKQHRQLMAEYDGTNAETICQKYNITAVWLKRLLAREKLAVTGNVKWRG